MKNIPATSKFCQRQLKFVWLIGLGFTAISSAMATEEKTAPVFPFSELGAKATADCKGEGLGIEATPGGARLHTDFQKLSGNVTREGLWLESTEKSGGRLRLIASVVSRGHHVVPISSVGTVTVGEKIVTFTRPGLTEEYSVSVDGVRQDFVVADRPVGEGHLQVDLALTGARAEAMADSAKLIFDGSCREIAYSRLHVTDATGKELAATLEAPEPDRLIVHVNDENAVYPVRIDPTFSDADWVALNPGIPGADSTIYRIAVDSNGSLYVAGDNLTFAGTVAARYIAKWNGSTWSALGAGLNDRVSDLAASGTNLYVGGLFTNAGGVPANYIAKWDGNSWSALGTGMNFSVSELAASGNNVYASGSFSTADGVPANHIAKWDGTTWSALGTGLTSVDVRLEVSGSDLYAGGDFTTAGGAPANYIAKWNGTTWSALGSGLSSRPGMLAVSGGLLYVGGSFELTVGGITSSERVVRWNGSSWGGVSNGMLGTPTTLVASGTDLYAGSYFSSAGVGYVNKWNGSTWIRIETTGMGGNDGLPYIYALAVKGTDVFAGGNFITAAGMTVNHIAKWNGSAWSALGSGINAWVNALVVSGTNIYAGGNFTAAGGVEANHIARWNGSTWSALGAGLNGPVYALAVIGNNVYAGGNFQVSNQAGTQSFCVAKWDGSNWSFVGFSQWNGTDGFPIVYALVANGLDLYAGGHFTSAAGGGSNSIAKWDGFGWSSLGAGLGSTAAIVNALAANGTDLYVGGNFASTAGAPGNAIAKWNGSAWSTLGSGMSGGNPNGTKVNALAVSGTDLYAGGSFTTAGGGTASSIAKWSMTGNNWSALGTGVGGANTYSTGYTPEVLALAVHPSGVYAAGTFSTAGGITTNGIARWNGSTWSALGTGMGRPLRYIVSALATDTSYHLYIGGFFNSAGTTLSPYIVAANLPRPPVITSAATASGMKGIVFSNYTITATNSPSSFAASGLPSGLSLNTSTGIISGTPTVFGTFPVTLTATNDGGTGQMSLSMVIDPPLPLPVITSPLFASGVVNTAFSFQLAASNSASSFAIQNGPAWLSVNPSTGAFIGTPTIPATPTVQVRASNSTGPGAWVTMNLSIAPHPNAPLITSASEVRGRNGDLFSFQLTASPAATSFVVTGTLPPGITLNTGTGLLSGTPSSEITSMVSVAGINDFGQGQSNVLNFVIGPKRQVPVITSAISFVANVGSSFSTTVTANNSPTLFQFANLPTGLVQSGSSGLISGTLSTPGSYAFTVKATNADGTGPTQSIVLNVQYNANAPKITALSGPTGYLGVPFSYAIQATPAATSFSATGLPAGLSLAAATGIISGTPTAAGDSTVRLQGTNASGLGEPRDLLISILPTPDAPEVTGSLSENATALVAFTYTVQTISKLPILSYTITGLPDGLTANTATGVISGAPTVVGSFDIKLRASSQVGSGSEKTLRLTVRAGSLLPKITSSASIAVLQGASLSYQMVATNPPVLGYQASGLPAGLVLNATTGLITGKPSTPGTYSVPLQASNVNGASNPMNLQIQVNPSSAVPVMQIPLYVLAYSNQPFSMQLQATNLPTGPWPAGTGIFAENLPAGMSLNSATGILSGFPTQTTEYVEQYIWFYGVNDSGRGRSVYVYFATRKVSSSAPTMIGPKQLSAISGQNLAFTIKENPTGNRHEFGITKGSDYHNDYNDAGANVSISSSVLPAPGKYSYYIAARTTDWAVLAGLPLSVAPAAGTPAIQSASNLVATAGTPLTLSLTASASPTRYELTAMSPAWPSGLAFNTSTGQFSGTVSQSGTISFLARAYNAIGAGLTKEISIYFAAPAAAPVITSGSNLSFSKNISPSSNPAQGLIVNGLSVNGLALNATDLTGQVGVNFFYQFQASGGVIRFNVSGLPDGLVYNENTGEISGQPQKPGTFPIIVTPIGQSVGGLPVTRSLVISPASGTPQMTSANQLAVQAGTPFTWQFAASLSPNGYNLPSLPDGLAFNSLTGVLSGTLFTPGVQKIIISAFNPQGEGGAQEFSLQVAAAAGTPVMNLAVTSFIGRVGQVFTGTLTATGTTTFYDATALPFGIALDGATGALSGTPVEPGVSTAQVWAVNANGLGTPVTVTITIQPALGTPTLTGQAVARVLAGVPYSKTFIMTPAATSFALDGAPAGWSFSNTTGVLNATPLAGIYNLTIEAWNAAGSSGKQLFQLRVLADGGALWLDQSFGDRASDPAVGGWNAKPFGDGVDNLLKYAFNMNGAGPDVSVMTVAGIAGLPLVTRATTGSQSVLRVVFLRRIGSGLNYTPQRSTTLNGFTAMTGVQTVTPIDSQWECVSVEEPYSLSITPKNFVRVQVSLP